MCKGPFTIKNITLVVFSEFVPKVGDTGKNSVFTAGEMLTRATYKRLTKKSMQLEFRCDALGAYDRKSC